MFETEIPPKKDNYKNMTHEELLEWVNDLDIRNFKLENSVKRFEFMENKFNGLRRSIERLNKIVKKLERCE